MKKNNRTVNGINMAYVDSHADQENNGSTLVLVHGYLASSYVFRDVYAKLIKHHRVIAMDLPGFGDSEKVNPDKAAYDRAFFADQVWALLDALGVDGPIDLLGHSMGGAVATKMTVTRQERIQKLILLDAMGIDIPPPFLGKIVMNPIVGKAIFMKVYNRFMLKQYLLNDVFYRKEACTEPLVDDMWRALATPEGKASAYATLQNTVHPDHVRANQHLLEGLEVETHLIWGEEDRIFPPQRCGEAMRQATQAKSYTVLAGTGHSPPEEMPEAFLQALAQVTACDYTQS